MTDLAAAPVSVVIPFHGGDGLTRACLESIRAAADPALGEIVLVDDASPEPFSPGGLAQDLPLRILRNASNRGFLHSANRGAAAAAGELLFFLNNDTLVKPRFLSACRELIARDERVAFAGSRLLYPDGRLQEAGSLLYSDGRGFNCGWGDSPGDEHYSFVREVHWCSAAALMARRDVFRSLRGFDPRFAPAFYEDVDLQLRARRGGWRCLYQPESEVVHAGGATYGREVDGVPQEGERRQERNRGPFLARHGDYLRDAGLPAAGPGPDRRLFLPGTRHLLFCEYTLPKPDRDAGSRRCFELLRLLQRDFQVTFVALRPEDLPQYRRRLTQEGIRVLDGGEEPAAAIEAALADLGEDRPGAVVLSRPESAAYFLPRVRRLLPGVPVVYDTVDLYFARHRSRIAAGARLGDEEIDPAREEASCRTYRALETYLIRAATRVWVVAEEERRLIADLRIRDAGAIDVVPVVYDPDPTPRPFAEREGLLFVGGFAHLPNRDAVRHFAASIAPLLDGEPPEVSLSVVGDGAAEAAVEGCGRLAFLGHLPDAAPAFDRARVACLPLVSGAGMKGKVAEALARGLPVVTTSAGAQGFPGAREYLLVAGTAEEFAASLRRLYHDEALWYNFREKGLAFAREYLGAGAAAGRLREIFHRIEGRQ